MSDKPWLASYPAGVPAEIDPHRFGSLPELFRASFAEFADQPAFTHYGTTLRRTG